MSSLDKIHAQANDRPPSELGDYQAVSTLAIAALISGIASASALIAIPLWIVPLVGILVSCLALVRIARSDGRLVGRPVALAGLALSVCFGTAGLTAHFNAQRLVVGQAREVVGQWFRALAEGNPEIAQQWALVPTRRANLADLARLKEYYALDPTRAETLAKFVKDEPVALLLRLGPHARVEPTLSEVNRINDDLQFVALQYRVTSDESGGVAPFTLAIALEQRKPPIRSQSRWTIRGWQIVDPESESSAD
ncbi:MAG TPA: DUF4190 domain-containing protein [Pirellulales bacterium]|nr:DUF4190 domain-containing protein [Pirellulales bacterium]